jgi:hypothetical protein
MKSVLYRGMSLVLMAALVLAIPGCAEKSTGKSARAQSPLEMRDNGPVMLAVYEAWFGQGDHIDVGYSSHDLNVLNQQVDQAKAMGLYGFLVDWYGNKKPFIDQSFALMQQVAKEKDFKVALMYDEWVRDPQRMTEDAIEALDTAYRKYIGPEAPHRDAYVRLYGHPVIFIWPKSNKTDWARVRQHVDAWAEPPILIYKDERSQYADLFDGYYAWIHPGKDGWQKDGSNWGQQYLENFYARMSRERSDKIIVGAAWPGFDDSRAAWSENRYMDAKCGKTLEQTLNYFHRYYDETKNPLPLMLIATWNDHEEGTAIERGIATVKPTTRRQSACSNPADAD